MKTIRIVAAAVLIVASAIALHVVQAQQAGATRTELQRHDLSVAGREVIQVRVDRESSGIFRALVTETIERGSERGKQPP